MNGSPLISICIPAYKRINYLQKLLESVSIQTYTDYEVIITDDSRDETVENVVKNFHSIKNISYYKNIIVLGTPENWNESVRKANGTWIKLMHDDDWFDNENSLQIFYEATLQKPGCSFFFSAYKNVYENSNVEKRVYLKPGGHVMLWLSPLNLFKKQYIGNPSCTLIKRDLNVFYDSDFKWVVDFEFYIRCLKKIKKFNYISKTLVKVGLNPEQVTRFSFGVPEIEIPENHLMLDKMGPRILRNVFVYDYYWRLYRNLEIRSEKDILKYYHGYVNPLLKQMVTFQKKIPPGILKTGVFSKLFMLLSYFLSFFKKLKITLNRIIIKINLF
jgi:glycosyltransferase involved in cell wall biosynthesis